MGERRLTDVEKRAERETDKIKTVYTVEYRDRSRDSVFITLIQFGFKKSDLSPVDLFIMPMLK